jgi:hypothetical protein
MRSPSSINVRGSALRIGENVRMLEFLFDWAQMLRRFKIGQFVEYRPSAHDRKTPGDVYQITNIVPPREGSGEPEYLIKRSSEGYERVVSENELLPTRSPEPDEGAPPKRG